MAQVIDDLDQIMWSATLEAWWQREFPGREDSLEMPINNSTGPFD
jgi:hypothetical protein